jgi:SAM-dependent methyltransferase
VTRRGVRSDFDEAFYARYYHRPATAAATLDEVSLRARYVLAYLDYLGVGVRSALDAGCGLGHWKHALERLDRSIRYTGVDSSEYLCGKYGWVHGVIADFKSRRKFDLVICQDMLQYLDAREVRRSVETIARLCRGALYLDVPTKDDFDAGVLDTRHTDGNIHVRTARWYRRVVAPYFYSGGAGVFIPNNSRTVVLGLERG